MERHLVHLRSGKVVYSHGGITLIHGDSTKVLPIEGQEIHLALTSPPYFMAGKKGNIYPDLQSYREAMRAVMRGCYEMLVEGGVLAWNTLCLKGLNLPAYAAIDLESVGFKMFRVFTWRKPDNVGVGFIHCRQNPVALSYIPNCLTEQVLVYTKGEKRKANSDFPINFALAEKFHTDIWDLSPVVKIGAGGKNRLGHDSPYPKSLAINLIEFFSCPGEVVLDPFVGSGTTLYAAAQVHPARRAIGIEILDKHIESCRLELIRKSHTLFAYQMTQGRVE